MITLFLITSVRDLFKSASFFLCFSIIVCLLSISALTFLSASKISLNSIFKSLFCFVRTSICLLSSASWYSRSALLEVTSLTLSLRSSASLLRSSKSFLAFSIASTLVFTKTEISSLILNYVYESSLSIL